MKLRPEYKTMTSVEALPRIDPWEVCKRKSNSSLRTKIWDIAWRWRQIWSNPKLQNHFLFRKKCLSNLIMVQLNFSGPWKNIITWWQYLFLQPNSTLSHQGHLIHTYPIQDTLELTAKWFLRTFRENVNFRPIKFRCALTFLP